MLIRVERCDVAFEEQVVGNPVGCCGVGVVGCVLRGWYVVVVIVAGVGGCGARCGMVVSMEEGSIGAGMGFNTLLPKCIARFDIEVSEGARLVQSCVRYSWPENSRMNWDVEPRLCFRSPL